jgi:hypothetical protein
VWRRKSKAREPFGFHPKLGVIVDKTIWESGLGLAEVCRTRDGMWQFLGQHDADVERAVVVGLGKVLKKWPEVERLYDLQPGHIATWNSDRLDWDIQLLPPELDY